MIGVGFFSNLTGHVADGLGSMSVGFRQITYLGGLCCFIIVRRFVQLERHHLHFTSLPCSTPYLYSITGQAI